MVSVCLYHRMRYMRESLKMAKNMALDSLPIKITKRQQNIIAKGKKSLIYNLLVLPIQYRKYHPIINDISKQSWQSLFLFSDSPRSKSVYFSYIYSNKSLETYLSQKSATIKTIVLFSNCLAFSKAQNAVAPAEIPPQIPAFNASILVVL